MELSNDEVSFDIGRLVLHVSEIKSCKTCICFHVNIVSYFLTADGMFLDMPECDTHFHSVAKLVLEKASLRFSG